MTDAGRSPTLREAQRIVALHECASHGHDWSVVQTLVRPVAVLCDRCGLSYRVAADDASEQTA